MVCAYILSKVAQMCRDTCGYTHCSSITPHPFAAMIRGQSYCKLKIVTCVLVRVDKEELGVKT
jgi:hypothetical protein